MVRFWPEQDIPEKDKNKEWCDNCLEYAIGIFNNYRLSEIERITRLYQGYNGIVDENKIKYLTQTYGKKIRSKFIDYKQSRPKIDRLYGEFLERPLNATVMTINPDAKSEKMDRYNSIIGMSAAAGPINTLRDKIGVDVFDGMEIPDTEDPNYLDKLNIKSKNEMYMQYILNSQITHLDLKSKLASNFLDVEITSMCFGKVGLDSNGEVFYRTIDPRNALFEEMDRDPFLHRSPYLGERRVMFIHEVISEFPELTPEQRTEINNIKANQDTFFGSIRGDSRQYYQMIDKRLIVETFTIEWMSVRPMYVKVSPDSKNPDEPYRKDIDPEEYEKNKAVYEKGVAKGEFTIETKWQMDLWEATKIGHLMSTRCRRVPYQIRSLSDPTKTASGYTQMLFNTVDGIRVSLQQLLEDYSFQYNCIMHMINRELAKAKGKAVIYDSAYLPKGMTVPGIMHDVANDGVIVINSAQDGNKIGRNLDSNGTQFKEVDLGVSAGVQILLTLKAEIMNMMDRISGINGSREGDIAASTTVTNAQSNIKASLTITESMFYYMNRHVENVLLKVAEYSKISYGILKTQRGPFVIGDDGVKFFEVTRELSYDDYCVFLADGGREMEIRQRLQQLVEVSLNAKEIRVQDVLAVEMSQTMVEAKAALEKGWNEIQELRQQQAKQEQDAQAENQKQSLAWQDHQFEQKSDLAITLARINKGLESGIETQKSQNKMILQQHAADMQQQANPEDGQQMLG